MDFLDEVRAEDVKAFFFCAILIGCSLTLLIAAFS